MAKASTGRRPAGIDAPAAGPLEIWVARARGAGALLGFAVVFLTCRGQGFEMADAALRGLGGAFALSLVAWWSALLVVQALMRSAAAQARREALEAAAAQAAAQAAAAGAPRTRAGAPYANRSDEPS